MKLQENKIKSAFLSAVDAHTLDIQGEKSLEGLSIACLFLLLSFLSPLKI